MVQTRGQLRRASTLEPNDVADGPARAAAAIAVAAAAADTHPASDTEHEPADEHECDRGGDIHRPSSYERKRKRPSSSSCTPDAAAEADAADAAAAAAVGAPSSLSPPASPPRAAGTGAGTGGAVAAHAAASSSAQAPAAASAAAAAAASPAVASSADARAAATPGTPRSCLKRRCDPSSERGRDGARRMLHFGRVAIREHERVPSGSGLLAEGSFPLGLGWRPVREIEEDLATFEKRRTPVRRSSEEIGSISETMRAHLLGWEDVAGEGLLELLEIRASRSRPVGCGCRRACNTRRCACRRQEIGCVWGACNCDPCLNGKT